jgi:leucyl/phenylalanyl-tRNA--protein transferase
MTIPLIHPDDNFTPLPPVERALEEPNGLLAAGGNLSPERLLMAYRSGIFPWFSPGEPILWWSPDPRGVLWPEKIHVSRSLRKKLRRGEFEIREDSNFAGVVGHCAGWRRDSDGTWITEEMFHSYCRLHELGYAHSVECWQEGKLVGGLYGVALGEVFFGESMFSRVPDASKAALVHLAQCGRYRLIDTQLPTEHLMSMGGETMARTVFLDLLQRLLPKA